MARKLITPNNYADNIEWMDERGTRFEKTSDEIITEPNQSFTLREILEQYTRGPVTGRDPIFEDPEVVEAFTSRGLSYDIEKMSKVEKAQLALDINAIKEEETKKLMEKRTKKGKEKFAQMIQQKAEELLKLKASKETQSPTS